MGSCLSIHPRNRRRSDSMKTEPLLVLQPAEVDDVLEKMANVEDRMEAEKRDYGVRSWKYCVLYEMRETYEQILKVGELPSLMHREIEKESLFAKIATLENRLRDIW